MHLVRRHLPRVVVAWLFCHVLAFTALVPRDCCAAHAQMAHRSGASSPKNDSTTAAGHHGHCAMAHADGACPMHAPMSPCRMTGSCGAPAATLAALLMGPAVLPAPPTFVPVALPSQWLPSRPPQPVSLVIPPDAPPPKA